MVEAGGVEIFRVLKTLNLLKTRDAQNSETQKLRLTLTGTYLERDERIRFLESGPSAKETSAGDSNTRRRY